MNIFWKVTALVLVAAVLVIAMEKQEKDISMLLSLAACTMVMITACTVLEPVMKFLNSLEALGNLPTGFIGILLKITGIGLVCEITELILSDCGNTSLAKGVHLFSIGLILNLSIPVFEVFLDLLQQILGAI